MGKRLPSALSFPKSIFNKDLQIHHPLFDMEISAKVRHTFRCTIPKRLAQEPGLILLKANHRKQQPGAPVAVGVSQGPCSKDAVTCLPMTQRLKTKESKQNDLTKLQHTTRFVSIHWHSIQTV